MTSIGQLRIVLDGIGHILADKRLKVPKYQRSYAWEKQNVNELFRDWGDALRQQAKEYFLGSIVTQGSEIELEIVDGQQRLATASILIAAIRDYLIEIGDEERAKQIEREYLLSRDLRTQAVEPKITLNSADNDFYRKAVLSEPKHDDRKTKPARESHERIRDAMVSAANFVKNLTATTQDPSSVLVDWIDFIKNKAKVIWVSVPDDSNAYIIFETLNDRGVELSIADLLKNFLFGRSGSRISEAQMNWHQMVGSLETVGGEETLLNYVRQLWSSENGTTREKDLYGAIKAKIVSEQAAIDLASGLASHGRLYAAMLNPKHEVWKQYGENAQKHNETLIHLRLEQYRPLLLAVLRSFSSKEVEKALRYLVACSVRFLVHGGLGGGTMEKNYCDSAMKVLKGDIKSAKDLAVELNRVVPTDAEFRNSFMTARVSKAYLARYYLQTLEREKNGEEQPELIVNPNSAEITLEHILPQNPSGGWTEIESEIAEIYFNRMGNLVLLQQSANSELGNVPFDEKRPIFAKSSFALTRKVAETEKWTSTAIDARQAELSELAIAAWSLAVF